MKKSRVLILSSGTEKSGGSGFQVMVEQTRLGMLQAEIAGAISQHAEGAVRVKARILDIPFRHWAGPFAAEGYQALVRDFEADYVMCSGWTKQVVGLNPARVINIHPALLPEHGGPGWYGRKVHERVLAAFQRGEIDRTGLTMHFVTGTIDGGPIIARLPLILIRPGETADDIGARVNRMEHAWQSWILNLVVNGFIRLNNEGRVCYNPPCLHELLNPGA